MEPTLPSKPPKARAPRGGSHNRKGGALVTRQNFSMHPDLLKAILDATNLLNGERSLAIVNDRSQRVTYSKVTAALVWLLKTQYLTPEGGLTPQLRQLIADYEVTPYEQPDEPPFD